MKLNTMAYAAACAITTAIAWTIGTLFIWTMPGPMMSTSGQMMHMNGQRFGWMVSSGGYFWGLVAWSITAAFFAWLFATIYNALLPRAKTEDTGVSEPGH